MCSLILLSCFFFFLLLITEKRRKLCVNAIPAIEEVNIFKDDSVIQYLNPASIASNTWISYGFPQTKRSDNLDNLRKLAENLKKKVQ
ncbi:hypothetical protein MKX03_001982 [Papaver bracteatum]|nr:hypothetical protein MKX03_001982 [Papaver bracteatum]